MTIIVHLDHEAEAFATENGGKVDPLPVKYWIKGTNDFGEARESLIANCEPVYDGLVPSTYHVARRGPEVWEGIVVYEAEPGDEWDFQFELGTQQQLITQSLSTIQKKAASPATAPDFQGSIGVTKDGIAGTQILLPSYSWSETHFFPRDAITDAYRKTMATVAGKMNAASFRGFDRGEVIFAGASGGLQKSSAQWQINYRFMQSPNQTGLTVGSITGIDKLGWDYLWINYIEQEDTAAARLIRVPFSVHIERVYEFADYDPLQLGK